MAQDSVERLELPIEAHGRRGEPGWALPRVVSWSAAPCRPDQGNTLPSDEYEDEPDVLAAKTALVAKMLRESRFCVAYCGAGMSRASGIADYASDPRSSVVRSSTVQNPFAAQPTRAHHVLVALERAGFVKELVQQNHDGLPQKAGWPQHKCNEIHGAWFDPSNPVVQFNGSLRTDLFEWLLRTEKTADMCLCLGTSLSGMNADRIAEAPARHCKAGQLGTVIINLQRTRLDASSSVRIWAKLDDALSMIAAALQVAVVPISPAAVAPTVSAKQPGTEVFVVPYDAQGKYDSAMRMHLDMREDSRLVVVAPGSVLFNKTGHVCGRTLNGDFLVSITKLRPSVLGRWWIEAAVNGTVPQLPLVNVAPQVWRHGVDPAPQMPGPPKSLEGAINFVQTHHLASDGVTHEWSLRVDCPEGTMEGIRQVVWKLPPHCHSGVVIRVEPPFLVSESERGLPFVVRVEVTFRAPLSGWVLTAEHKLSFDTEGDAVKTTTVPISLAEKSSECTIC